MAKVKVDGKYYEKGTEPDLGSIICVDASRSPIREYQGHPQDALKLPIYDDLGHGSSAKLIDPNGIEKTIIANYDAYIKHWVNLKGGIIV